FHRSRDDGRLRPQQRAHVRQGLRVARNDRCSSRLVLEILLGLAPLAALQVVAWFGDGDENGFQNVERYEDVGGNAVSARQLVVLGNPFGSEPRKPVPPKRQVIALVPF